MLLSLNGTLQTNEAVLVTTGGAPGGTTYTVMSYQVSKFVPGFVTETVNIGYGCAMSIVTSLILCSIALIYSKSKRTAPGYILRRILIENEIYTKSIYICLSHTYRRSGAFSYYM